MIQLTDVFCVLFVYIVANNIWLPQAADSIIRDPIKRPALYMNRVEMPMATNIFWEYFLKLQKNYLFENFLLWSWK